MRPPLHAGVRGQGRGRAPGYPRKLSGRAQSAAHGRKELKSKDREWPIVTQDWSPHSRGSQRLPQAPVRALQSTPCPTRQTVSEVAMRPKSSRQATGSGKRW